MLEIIPSLANLIYQYSYFGIFLLSLISTSTIFLPLPLYAIEFVVSGLGLNPILVGIFAGLGSTIGEITGYLAGLGGRSIAETKKIKSKFLLKFTKFFDKSGFIVILIAALLPFPFDVIGILAGASRYDIKKFFIATLIGKTIKNLLIAYSGAFIGTPLFVWLRIVEEVEPL